MADSQNTSILRLLLSLCAALLSIAFCVARRHVQIDLADPSTLLAPFQHRCGQLMLLCIAWAVLEAVVYLRPALPRYSTAP